MNYFRFYVGDYLRDTARLSMLEHGAYALLLGHYYAEELPIPPDMVEVYTMVRAMTPADRKAVDKVLDRYFTKQPDGYHNARADKEIAVSKQARDNGKRGGRPVTGSGTETETSELSEYETEMETAEGTGCLTERGGGSGHPPTTNHQPPTPNHQETTAAPDASRRGPKKVNGRRISFDPTKGEFQGITEEDELRWQDAYPAVPIPPEIGRAAAWAKANPHNRKSNWERFLVNWFSRAQDRAARVR